MRRVVYLTLLAVVLLGAAAGNARQSRTTPPTRRNVIIFVADGLRHGSVNATDTPALWRIRTEGVYFRNSYSLFPTFTTANASAIATGHGLGDTGDFSNRIWIGYPVFESGAFGRSADTPVPFVEDDQVLADLSAHFGGNYLGEATLLQLAQAAGYNTAAVGKIGPTAIQAAPAVAAVNGRFPTPATIVIDDATGSANGVPLPDAIAARLQQQGIPPEAPSRTNGYNATSRYSNGNTAPGTLAANVVQQQWMNEVTTRGVLPMFEADRGRPFALLFWSRDPDGSQHNQGDSDGRLTPGINGPTSRLGVRNADRSLQQILAWLDARPAIKANTDVIVTADHGFATISRRDIDAHGAVTKSAAATHTYVDGTGKVDTPVGTLPTGFLAIDLALDLKLSLFDPDRQGAAGAGSRYRQIRLSSEQWEHPINGSGLLGPASAKPDGSDATAIVAANGGSDLIYVPDGNADTVRRIVDLLLGYDYVSGLFVDDRLGDIPGTLPLSAIGLAGSSRLPRPSIVVAFRMFDATPGDLSSGVMLSDTTLQQGQGMHGGFGRENTYINMAAFGPDFKQRFVDDAPVSNADLAPTLASLLGLNATPTGTLRGRIVNEALRGRAAAPAVRTQRLRSATARDRQTVLNYQEFDGRRYLADACFLASGDAERAPCR